MAYKDCCLPPSSWLSLLSSFPILLGKDKEINHLLLFFYTPQILLFTCKFISCYCSLESPPAFVRVKCPKMSYPPAGGGISDPRMARDSRTPFGSFPPCSTSSGLPAQLHEHSFQGYNQNPYGDFSQPAFSSTAPAYGDPGYPRLENFPTGSRMEREYQTYKSADRSSQMTATYYKNQHNMLGSRQSLGNTVGPAVRGGHFQPQQHAQLAPLAMNASNGHKQ